MDSSLVKDGVLLLAMQVDCLFCVSRTMLTAMFICNSFSVLEFLNVYRHCNALVASQLITRM